MLDRAIVLVGILGGWLVAAAASSILKRMNHGHLPAGSVSARSESSGETHPVVSPAWAQAGVTLAMGGNILIQIVFVLLVLLGLWENVAPLVAWDLPQVLNWIGLFGIWLHLAWGVSVIYYNTNYTPLYSPMERGYILATGGPYAVVRHPQYVSHVTATVFVFLLTGTWLIGLTAVGWASLPRQVAQEEKALLSLFNGDYELYSRRVGRLVPRIRHRRM